MIVLYSRDGDKLIFDYAKNGRAYGHVTEANGTSYPTQLVDSIVARGYWEVVTPLETIMSSNA